MRLTLASALGAASVVLASPAAHAQLRVAAWNISNYGGGRVPQIHASVYASFEGRSMAPDVFLLQEFLSDAALAAFVAALNSAPGSPGDWAAAPFVNGPDTDSALAYRTGKLELLNTVVVAVGGVSPNHPRNIMRYDLRPVGYGSPEAVFACYSVHMKSGDSSEDQQRRLLEAQRIRDDAEALPEGWSFIIGGDFNIQSSNQAAYQEMVGAQINDDGRFFDPISTPGSWNNNGAFRFVHTQDPVGAGGMDDRHDQLLLSDSLIEQSGFAYIGAINPATMLPFPYSTVTWNDPNHSYRSWGNDGSTFNVALNPATNAMVGPTIGQALKDICAGAGHLPVFLDLRVPAEIESEDIIDFGTVPQYAVATQTLNIANAGDTMLWTESGLATLNYSLEAPAGFTAPDGPFAEAPGGAANMHEITLDTSTPGEISGVLTIYSDAPDEPVRLVMLSAVVEAELLCPGDTNGDGEVNFADINNVLSSYNLTGKGLVGDLDNDGDVDFADLNAVLTNYGAVCSG